MSQAADEFLELVSGRRGHFQLESGHHGELWLDLDALFAQPARIAPLVARLAATLRPHEVAGVCGPLVGGAFLAQSVASALEVEFSFTERLPSPSNTGLYQARYRLPPGPRKGSTHPPDRAAAGSRLAPWPAWTRQCRMP